MASMARVARARVNTQLLQHMAMLPLPPPFMLLTLPLPVPLLLLLLPVMRVQRREKAANEVKGKEGMVGATEKVVKAAKVEKAKVVKAKAFMLGVEILETMLPPIRLKLRLQLQLQLQLLLIIIPLLLITVMVAIVEANTVAKGKVAKVAKVGNMAKVAKVAKVVKVVKVVNMDTVGALPELLLLQPPMLPLLLGVKEMLPLLLPPLTLPLQPQSLLMAKGRKEGVKEKVVVRKVAVKAKVEDIVGIENPI